MGWVTAVWTAVFPLSDWSLQLMAMANAGLALFFVDRIARQFVTGHKRILVLLLLMLTPAYQFHAQRFNANAVLLALWPPRPGVFCARSRPAARPGRSR